MPQTQKRTLLEAEKPYVTNTKCPKFGKIQKNHFLFSFLVIFGAKSVEKGYFWWSDDSEKRSSMGWKHMICFKNVKKNLIF